MMEQQKIMSILTCENVQKKKEVTQTTMNKE